LKKMACEKTMRYRWILPVALFFSICTAVAPAQNSDSVTITVLSIENISPRQPRDLPPANVRLNLRITNGRDRDVFIFGSKYGKEFDVWYHLLRFDVTQEKWTIPIFDWEVLPADEKVPRRLKKGAHFDFSSLMSKADSRRLIKVATYFGHTKVDKPIMIETSEFYIHGAKDH